MEHTTGLPLATLSFNEEGGEIAAVRALLEKVEVAGRVLTVDALHTTRETARVIVETHGADYLMTVKENAPETHELLSTIDWKRDATGFFQEEIDLAHGRIEQRSIQVMTPLEGLLNYPHVAQIFRLTRRRTDARQNGTGQTSREQVYGITSVPADRATPPATPGLEPWSLGGRSQSPPPGHPLCRRRLSGPHPIRTGKQCDLHQHRACDHHSPNFI